MHIVFLVSRGPWGLLEIYREKGRNTLNYVKPLFLGDVLPQFCWWVLVPYVSLVSHYSAIGDTISCDAHCSAMGFRGVLFCDTPPPVRQGHYYTCLAIRGGGGVFRSGH